MSRSKTERNFHDPKEVARVWAVGTYSGNEIWGFIEEGRTDGKEAYDNLYLEYNHGGVPSKLFHNYNEARAYAKRWNNCPANRLRRAEAVPILLRLAAI